MQGRGSFLLIAPLASQHDLHADHARARRSVARRSPAGALLTLPWLSPHEWQLERRPETDKTSHAPPGSATSSVGTPRSAHPDSQRLHDPPCSPSTVLNADPLAGSDRHGRRRRLGKARLTRCVLFLILSTPESSLTVQRAQLVSRARQPRSVSHFARLSRPGLFRLPRAPSLTIRLVLLRSSLAGALQRGIALREVPQAQSQLRLRGSLVRSVCARVKTPQDAERGRRSRRGLAQERQRL